MSAGDRLVLTLVKGLAGKGKYKNAVQQYLGLSRPNQSVEVPNNFEFRATAKKVQHLLRIETREEYDARLARDAARQAVRAPIRVTHVTRRNTM